MDLAELAIKRPVFIICLVISILIAGLVFMRRLPVDLFPNVNFPYVMVTTLYPGAAPAEIETLIAKPLEEEIGTVAGLKHVNSTCLQGMAIVFAEFTLETDAKWAEQQIRDKVGLAKTRLPKDILEPLIQRMDPADMPVLQYALEADLPDNELFDIADDFVRPKFEQINQVSTVRIFGGRKREIQVKLDREKLKQYDLSAAQVAAQLGSSGENIPLGKTESGDQELVHRSMSQFKSIQEIRKTIIRFFGNDVPVTVGDIARVEDTLQDETTRAYTNGKKSLFLQILRQSGANTVEVVDQVHKRVEQIRKELSNQKGKPRLILVRDGATEIRNNILDVKESIIIGVILAIVVVFLFLANLRSTIITGLALPNSLIGAFILIYAAGFSINMMSLLALSLAVGLLVDDAIVVRENIFRHIENGMDTKTASLTGTRQVRLAVIATTMTILAVFFSIAFIKGVVGQFLKEFGLTVCFAMLISLFDALTVAPMLSTYFGGLSKKKSIFDRLLKPFDRFQDWLAEVYQKILRIVLHAPIKTLAVCVLVFIACSLSLLGVSKTFMPTPDLSEYEVRLELPPGTSLARTDEVARKVDQLVRKNPEVELTTTTVGSWTAESNKATIYYRLIPFAQRKATGIQIKERLREQLIPFADAKPQVIYYDPMGGGLRPFVLQLIGSDPAVLEPFGEKTLAYLQKNYPALKEIDSSSKKGKPEFHVILDEEKAKRLGIAGNVMGLELRMMIEGAKAAKFRDRGLEYDVRVRLQDDQRHLEKGFGNVLVPNLNMSLIHLSQIAKGIETTGPTQINRHDRMREFQITADLAENAGIGDIIKDMDKILNDTLKMPEGIRFKYIGDAEMYEEMMGNMIFAALLGIVFIYLVLASLYESFIIPLTIMLALPLALCGAFMALYIAHDSLNILSMISCIMLLGVATKNSILLVDYANQLVAQGKSRFDALMEAGKVRLRPILMTTMALIAGTLPIAIGLNESSRQRTSMGVAMVGGLISSTLLTLIVVPAAYSFIDSFRHRALAFTRKHLASGSKTAQLPGEVPPL